MEMGSIDDIGKKDYRNNKPTLVGYCAQIIARYKEIVPDAKFFFSHSRFPDGTALLKSLYLATFEARKKWTMPLRNWGKGLRRTIHNV